MNLSDPSLELTENIPAGTTLPAHCLRQRPILRRGQTVDAVFRDGSLTISLKVETLEDGALGQTVRVRNLKTNRDLFGKIQNEETMHTYRSLTLLTWPYFFSSCRSRSSAPIPFGRRILPPRRCSRIKKPIASATSSR